MILIEELLHSLMPELVLVAGDEHASLAFTLGAKKLKIPVARLEGGLRSGETGLPEETNRKLIDYVSDYLFTTDLNANANLLREGISEERLYFVGNILVETLYGHLSKAAFSQVLNHLDLREGLEIRPFGVVSLRRPSNVDHFQTFREICDALSQISKGLPLIFPCHPRTQQRIRSYGLENLFGKSLLHEDRIIIIDPLSHLDFLHLKAHSKIILTDSDGIQEEATILGIPCLTLRETTERPVTISQGTNRLVGSRKEDILKGYALAMEDYKEPHMKPERWDGRTSENVVRILAQISEKGRSRYREESEMVAWNRR